MRTQIAGSLQVSDPALGAAAWAARHSAAGRAGAPSWPCPRPSPSGVLDAKGSPHRTDGRTPPLW